MKIYLMMLRFQRLKISLKSHPRKSQKGNRYLIRYPYTLSLRKKLFNQKKKKGKMFPRILVFSLMKKSALNEKIL
jgi:hypothetical protein